MEPNGSPKNRLGSRRSGFKYTVNVGCGVGPFNEIRFSWSKEIEKETRCRDLPRVTESLGKVSKGQ